MVTWLQMLLDYRSAFAETEWHSIMCKQVDGTHLAIDFASAILPTNFGVAGIMEIASTVAHKFLRILLGLQNGLGSSKNGN